MVERSYSETVGGGFGMQNGTDRRTRRRSGRAEGELSAGSSPRYGDVTVEYRVAGRTMTCRLAADDLDDEEAVGRLLDRDLSAVVVRDDAALPAATGDQLADRYGRTALLDGRGEAAGTVYGAPEDRRTLRDRETTVRAVGDGLAHLDGYKSADRE